MPVLSYCMNVHPGETLEEVLALLAGPVAAVRAEWRDQGPMGAGLWLAEPAARAIVLEDGAAERTRAALGEAGLFAFTANAFPIGGFHAVQVKESVYRPTWAEPARLDYTLLACRALARLLPEGQDGSVSTMPVGYKSFAMSEAALDAAGRNLARCALELDRIAWAVGREVRLALEPEPLAVLETTAEAIAFLEERVFADAGHQEATLRDRIGVCVDACHLACAFEDVPASLAALRRAGVRVVKAQLSSALELRDPASNLAGRERLRSFDEPRYLHQSAGRRADGRLVQANDIGDLFAGDALHPAFTEVPAIRTHFHVPLDWGGDHELGTTRPDLEASLGPLAAATDHLEVETYTWSVLPAELASRDPLAMIVGELRWAQSRLAAAGVDVR